MYKVGRNSPCLCGSGVAFKRCCKNIQMPSEICLNTWGEEFRALLDSLQYNKALEAVRCRITHYSAWHQMHTTGTYEEVVSEKSLLAVDIGAMSEFVNQLMSLLRKSGFAEQIPNTLDRLRRNITHEAWQRKITYFQAVHKASGLDWNIDRAREEFKRLGDLRDDDDNEIVEMYLEFYYDQLSYVDRVQLIERILSKARDSFEKLYYGGVLAMQSFLINEINTCVSQLQNCIDQYRIAPAIEKTDIAELRFAETLDMLAVAASDESATIEAVQIYEKLRHSPTFSARAIQHIYAKLAEALMRVEQYSRAQLMLRKALEGRLEVSKETLLAICLRHTSGTSEALAIIEDIDTSGCPNSELLDYAFTYAWLAVESGDRLHLLKAEKLLSQVSSPHPYFESRRASLIISILQALRTPTADVTALSKTLRSLGSLIRSVSGFIIIRPNIMGVGIDCNKVLDKLIPEPPIENPIEKSSRNRSSEAGIKANKAS